jgi:hypothetical protein
MAHKGCNSLILLVGAGRFERPTPCAQGVGRPDFVRSISPVLTSSWEEVIYNEKSGM